MAFEKAVSIARSSGITSFIFLGDAIGYLPSVGVLEQIANQKSQFTCVAGNHEHMLMTDVREHDNIYQLRRTRQLMGFEHLELISMWPSQLRLESVNKQILLQHGSPHDPIWGYVYPNSELDVFTKSADVVLMANTHYPFVRSLSSSLLINPGSCGLPRDDGRFGSFAILDIRCNEAHIVRFNIELETREMMGRIGVIHPTVKSVFDRRSTGLVGDVWL